MRVSTLVIVLSILPASGVEPATRPATATAPALPPASNPREALRSLNLAQRDGDADAIRSLFLTGDESGEHLIAAMAEYTAALVALHRAAEKAYGPDGANTITGDINAQSAEGLTAIEKAAVAIDGNHALVTYRGATDPPIKLIKVEGRWKLPTASLLEGVKKGTEQRELLKELLIQTGLARETAHEIEAGKYKEGPARAAEVWRTRLLEPQNNKPKPKP